MWERRAAFGQPGRARGVDEEEVVAGARGRRARRVGVLRPARASSASQSPAPRCARAAPAPRSRSSRRAAKRPLRVAGRGSRSPSRHSLPTITSVGAAVASACSRARPRSFVLSSAVVTPSFASPIQVARNSGRFSISSAATSPRRSPSAKAACAARFACAFDGAVRDARILEEHEGLLGMRRGALLEPVADRVRLARHVAQRRGRKAVENRLRVFPRNRHGPTLASERRSDGGKVGGAASEAGNHPRQSLLLGRARSSTSC